VTHSPHPETPSEVIFKSTASLWVWTEKLVSNGLTSGSLTPYISTESIFFKCFTDLFSP
jgi:hypothetical protein